MNRPVNLNDPTGHEYSPPCPFCNITLWDYSKYSSKVVRALDRSILLAVGCLLLTCNVDREDHKVVGPTYTQHMAAAIPGPMADVEFPTVGPGPFAGGSIPARSPARKWLQEEIDAIDAIGRETGCHTCGTKDPGTAGEHFIPDHQPPSKLNFNNREQRLYPQCLQCSRRQGGLVTQILFRLFGGLNQQ